MTKLVVTALGVVALFISCTIGVSNSRKVAPPKRPTRPSAAGGGLQKPLPGDQSSPEGGSSGAKSQLFPDGTRIVLRSEAKRVAVYQQPSGKKVLKLAADAEDQFVVQNNGQDGTISLRLEGAAYVRVAVRDQQLTVGHFTNRAPGVTFATECFFLEKHNGGYAIKSAYNKQYVAANPNMEGRLFANVGKARDAQVFEVSQV